MPKAFTLSRTQGGSFGVALPHVFRCAAVGVASGLPYNALMLPNIHRGGAR